MIAFQCNIAGATGTQAVAKGNPARRCGEDPKANKPADPSNCTIGARTPSYWYQLEQNNVRFCRINSVRLLLLIITGFV